MEGKTGISKRTWKVLAVIVCVCLVAAAAAVVVILIVRGNGSEISQEELVQQYEEIKREADAAIEEMEELQSEEAQADAAAYEEQVNEVVEVVEDLEQSVEQASADVSSAAGEVTETAQEYEQLLNEIEAYYAYLDSLTQQALSQLEYLRSVVPAFEEVEKLQSVVTRIQKAPAQLSQGQFGAQLTDLAGDALSLFQSSKSAVPESMQGSNEAFDSLVQQLSGISGQMSQALSDGDRASFDALAGQLSAGVEQARAQLSSNLNSAIGSLSSGLASAAQKVDAAMPKK